MVRKNRSDELLNEIACSMEIEFLSDLRHIQSPDRLISALAAIRQSRYTIGEWKEAMAYIFNFNGAPLSPSEEYREIVLWNTGQWGAYITEIMEKYFSSRSMNGCFHYITGRCEPKLPPGRKYLIFYHSSGINHKEVREFADRFHLNMSFAAICGDYNDGIQSMDRGDSYALKLPLEEEKIIRCYEHFNAMNEKEIFV